MVASAVVASVEQCSWPPERTRAAWQLFMHPIGPTSGPLAKRVLESGRMSHSQSELHKSEEHAGQ